MEKYNKMAEQLLTTASKPLPNVTPASAKNIGLKDLRIVLQKVDEQTDLVSYAQSRDLTLKYNVTTESAKNIGLKDLRIVLQKVDELTDLVSYAQRRDLTLKYNVTTESAKTLNNKEKKIKDPCIVVKQRNLAKNSQDENPNTTCNVTTKSAKLGYSNEKNSKILCTTEEQNHGYTGDTDSTISYEITKNVIGTIYFLTRNYTKLKGQTTKKQKTKHKAKPTKIQGQCKQVNKPLRFKCEAKGCQLHAHKQKELNAHYRSVHKKKLKMY